MSLDEYTEASLLLELRARWQLRRQGLCDYCATSPLGTPDCLQPERHHAPLPAPPLVAVLCGSTRFREAFEEAQANLTHEGKIVLSVGSFPGELGHAKEDLYGTEHAAFLDELHKRKIDIADEIHVLNVDNYVGSSTRSEIQYAAGLNKPIYFLEPTCWSLPNGDCVSENCDLHTNIVEQTTD